MDMNPELPQVRPNAEIAPQIPGGIEYFPDGSSRSVESRPTYSPEQQPAHQEQLSPQAPIATPVDPTQLAVPQAIQPVSQPTDGVATGLPAIAADDDLMEKEWVDKVKKIIDLTRGNPYEQAKSVAALQADYLKKRYNRTIGEGSGEQTAA